MPLSDDLLKPIPGDNPSGSNLRFDPIFLQLKEASSEGEQGGVLDGNFELAQVKKVDHRAVIRMATDALEKRSKDIQLAAYLTASMIRMEGFAAVAPSIDLLHQLQETFWPTIYPEPDEGEDYEMRAVSVEKAARGISEALVTVPLTSIGFTYDKYLESRAVGYEKDATGEAKKAARKDAVDHGKLKAEEFDKAFAGSPKSLYLDGAAALAEALQAIDRLDTFQRGAYKDYEPSLRDLRASVEEVHHVVEYLLNERRKTEPDPVPAPETPPPGEAVEGEAPEAAFGTALSPRPKSLIQRARNSEGAPKTVDDAYAQVVESALFLFEKNPASPVPYLICAGLRTGETAMQEAQPAPGFAVGPDAEVRHLLRSLAASSSWVELLRESLPLLASECARGWLDLHRYVHKAGTESGAPAIAMAVQGTVKSLLTMRPELRNWILEDDTGAANPETQKWLETL